ncbi:hypothetical protein [Foetidibacter luteolus]|uniref:hypothetical protein n=1 Tax=Foetidibacter luteolus TaxID=2608880 RepID=UPI001A987380|nr:hypothetical protein [Foetidibacter luteolus]
MNKAHQQEIISTALTLSGSGLAYPLQNISAAGTLVVGCNLFRPVRKTFHTKGVYINYEFVPYKHVGGFACASIE